MTLVMMSLSQAGGWGGRLTRGSAVGGWALTVDATALSHDLPAGRLPL